MDAAAPRPLLRGRLHLLAFLAALPAGLLLLLGADRALTRAAAAVYATSLVLLFGTSAAYHCFARSPGTRAFMQRLDHAMIYVLIAGTYTPVCLAVLPPRWGIPILAVVGTGAVVGMALKLFAFDGAGRWASILYLVLGWVAVIAAPVLAEELTGGQIALLLLGGLAYTIGFPVLFLKRPDPWPRVFGYHEIWHTLTVVAAVLHFAAVATLVT